MAVDRYTGKITWTPEDSGSAEVVLGARTVHGRVSRQSWTIRVRKAVAARTPRPNPRFASALRRKARARRVACAPVFRLLWRAPPRRAERASRIAASPGLPPGAALPLRL